MVFCANWPITTDGSDRCGRISLPYLCSLLQETATLHADELGWGYQAMKEQGCQWALSRQWLKMTRYPRWRESVNISTWPSGRKHLTWTRDYRICNAQGDTLGVATSLWFVMDREKRKPRPAPFDWNETDAEKVREEELKSLPPLREPRTLCEILSGYHDIDVHGHVNNVRYLQWMLDALGDDFLAHHVLKELQINYLAEGFVKDALQVQLDASGTGHGLLRRRDGMVLSRMRTEWVDDD